MVIINKRPSLKYEWVESICQVECIAASEISPRCLQIGSQLGSLLINQGFNQKVTTLVFHLRVEEEFQLVTYLPTCHTEYLVEAQLLIDLLNVKLNIFSERFSDNLSIRELHPELLESF